MTRKNLTATVVILCTAFFINSLGTKHIDRKTEIEKMKLAVEMDNQKNTAITEIQKNTADAMISAMQFRQSF